MGLWPRLERESKRGAAAAVAVFCQPLGSVAGRAARRPPPPRSGVRSDVIREISSKNGVLYSGVHQQFTNTHLQHQLENDARSREPLRLRKAAALLGRRIGGPDDGTSPA